MSTKLACLSPAAINDRFVAATDALGKQFLKAALLKNPWNEMFRENRIRQVMTKKGCTRKKAQQIIRAEERKWAKEYNSPLKVAERKIVELEQRLQTIKDFINDPNYLDRFSD